MSQRPIYLDCHSTTPVDERVVDAMLPYFTEHFGNPSSISHIYGWEAEAAVKKARETIANAINASPEEIIFTSGATEANNLAIKGVAEAYFSQGQHIITVQTEHSAVIDPCNYLKTLGFEITFLTVQKNGIINLNELEKAFRDDTILVSVMAANNEIGVLQPLTEIGEICRERNILFHSDSAQAIGKISLDVQEMKIDLMSLTAHKIYGAKGIGALYVRRRNPRVNIASQQHGGGQERGIRSGTLYTPQIVGFGKAVEIALQNQTTENEFLTQLRKRLWEQISQLKGIYLNGHPTQRLAGNLNVSVEGVDGSALLLGLQQVMAVSSGSACSST
ncbi:MAG: aminotransferase class V-fold PLP-dependent enzyme, partial [Cyanobacteria bacterium J06628_3]